MSRRPIPPVSALVPVLKGDMRSIKFQIDGEPRGKGRPRFFRRGTFVSTYTDKLTVNAEQWWKLSFQQEAQKVGWKIVPQGIPVKIEMDCFFSYPKSMSAKKRAANMYVTKKPDLDNAMKLIDALNGIAWHDDSQVVLASLSKMYTDGQPRSVVTISTLQQEESDAAIR